MFFWNALSSSGSVLVAPALSLVFGQHGVIHILHIAMAVSTMLAVSLGMLYVANDTRTHT